MCATAARVPFLVGPFVIPFDWGSVSLSLLLLLFCLGPVLSPGAHPDRYRVISKIAVAGAVHYYQDALCCFGWL